MQGKRILPDLSHEDHFPLLNPGEYRKHGGIWYGQPPLPWQHTGCNLAAHQVTEHADGTITVSPSILISCGRSEGNAQWHGYLERGVWREC